MEKITQIIVNILTLGIPAIINAIQENKKGGDEYWYKPDKKGRCRYYKKCCFRCHCGESEHECKKLHCEHEAAKEI